MSFRRRRVAQKKNDDDDPYIPPTIDLKKQHEQNLKEQEQKRKQREEYRKELFEKTKFISLTQNVAQCSRQFREVEQVSSDEDDDEDDFDMNFDGLSIENDDDDEDVILVTNEMNPNCNRASKMNEQEIIMATLLHQARFNTTNYETQVITKLINCSSKHSSCPIGETPRISYSDWNTLIKKVPNAFTPRIKKYYYANCGELVGPVMDNFSYETCTNQHEECNVSVLKKKENSFFTYISLENWLKHQIPMYFDKLRLKQTDTKMLHDVTNCHRYKTLVKSDGVCSVLTITLGWDGVAINEANNKSMWPLVAYLNELPFQTRILNPMLIALHSGTKKPESDLMFRPLIEELIHFEKTPLEIRLLNGETKFFYVKLLFIIADAPARAAVLNCAYFNSKNGCHMCKIEGKWDDRFKSTLFMSNTNFSPPLRTDKEWRQAVSESSSSNNQHVKGKCEIMKLEYINLPLVCPPEIMHSQYLGTVKSILERWTGMDVVKRKWFQAATNEQKRQVNAKKLTNEQLTIIDKRLALIKFPKNALRRMPQLSDKRSLKAIEYEVLLYFGWPAFKGIVTEDRLQNFQLLAFILSSLSLQYIANFRIIEKAIEEFLGMFDTIYSPDESFMWKINLHYLKHLPVMVQTYGPLPVQSAYSTENTMGHLAKRVMTGTNVSHQVMKKVMTFQSITSTCLNNMDKYSYPFMELLDTYIPKLNMDKVINQKPRPYELSEEEKGLFSSTSEYNTIDRIMYNNQMICTVKYNETKAIQTLNHCIKTMNQKYYIVKNILIHSDTQDTLLICSEFTNVNKVYVDPNVSIITPSTPKFSYINTYKRITPKLTKIKLSDFLQLCSYFTIDTTSYIIEIFNKHL